MIFRSVCDILIMNSKHRENGAYFYITKKERMKHYGETIICQTKITTRQQIGMTWHPLLTKCGKMEAMKFKTRKPISQPTFTIISRYGWPGSNG